MVNKLSVGELCELSDHSPIKLSIKSSNNIITSEAQPDISVCYIINLPAYDDNKLLQKYKKQYYINGASMSEILSLAMESSEITSFLTDISNELDYSDLSIEEVIASL